MSVPASRSHPKTKLGGGQGTGAGQRGERAAPGAHSFLGWTGSQFVGEL